MLSFFRRKKPQEAPAVGKPPQFSAEELASVIPAPAEQPAPAVDIADATPASDAGAAPGSVSPAPAAVVPAPAADIAAPAQATAPMDTADAALIPANAAPAAAAGKSGVTACATAPSPAVSVACSRATRGWTTTCSTRSRPRC